MYDPFTNPFAFPGTSNPKSEDVRAMRDALGGIGIHEAKSLLGHNAGMTLRDWLAGRAMQAIIAKGGPSEHVEYATGLARISYQLADAMLAERSK